MRNGHLLERFPYDQEEAMDSATSSYKWSTWVPLTFPVSSFLPGLPCTLLYMAAGLEAIPEPSRQPVSLPHHDHWPLPWVRTTSWGSQYVGKITTQGQQKASLLCKPPQSHLLTEALPRSSAADSYRSSDFHFLRNFHTDFHIGCLTLHSYQEWTEHLLLLMLDMLTFTRKWKDLEIC